MSDVIPCCWWHLILTFQMPCFYIVLVRITTISSIITKISDRITKKKGLSLFLIIIPPFRYDTHHLLQSRGISILIKCIKVIILQLVE